MRISKNKLALAMLNAGVESIRYLATVSGVSINTISRSNNGGTVKLSTLRRIAAALKVDPAELLEEV
ncbi:helix-turn-helix domain-containing protein [Lawsonibacter sp. JLR.KK007]|uniref:helix-turn-helix domain-containing protein n=1 Tax=Lawsonibacter sp. JLR.KK007 TaxID=3114293 RepID=UPI002FEEA571